MKTISKKFILPLLAAAWFFHPVFSQQILLDKPVRAGQLTLFPELGNDANYYYLPDKIRLGKHPDGKPMLSFLKYVENVRSGAGAAEAKEGEGGGIVHAVVELSVPKEMLDEARQDLRKIKSNGAIVGPIVYKGGTIALISSFTEANGNLAKKVIGLGKAPILDNEKAAISILLTKLGAKILWESFKTPTPDLSVSMEMEISGFRSPIGATIEANFDQIYEHKNFQVGVTGGAGAVVFAGEIKASFDDLVKSGAIKVTQIGSDASIEKAVEAAYTKLTNMMFDPAGGTGTPSLNQLGIPGTGQPSALDRATTLLNNARQDARQENQRREAQNRQDLAATEASVGRSNPGGTGGTSVPVANRDTTGRPRFHSSEPISSVPNDRMAQIEDQFNRRQNLVNQGQVTVPSLAVAFSFEMKKIRQRGIFRIDLNKYNSDNLVTRFDENFGQINCADCFREVNLDDPLYVQREIVAFLDGANAGDFDKYINTVNVTMRKKHEGGQETHDEVRVDRKNFNAEGNNFKLLYGWKGDNNRNKWFDYEYKTDWFFFGGYTLSSGWQKGTSGTIPLSAPFVKRNISLEADPDIVREKNIRSIEVKLYSKLGEFQQVKEFRMNTRNGQLSGLLEMMQPKDIFDYDYEVTWYLMDGTTKSSGRRTTNGANIFVDTI